VTIPGLPKKRINYAYDERLNLSGTILDAEGVIYPLNGTETKIVNNGLNMPETLSFRKNAGSGYDQLVSDVDYGPNRMPTSIQFTRNGTSYAAGYNSAGMLNSASLTGGAVTLYHASYDYDDVGNISGITSTAPSLTATFGYDPLNRLTSANYSLGVGAYSYEYDAYGNMLRVIHNGTVTAFEKTYDAKNQIEDFEYDARGNLISKGTMLYYWDAQNRLRYVQNTAGEVLGKYLYDDRGLRLSALPQLPEINVKHEELDIPDEGDVYLRASPGNSTDETLTILNLGDANLNLGALSITGDVGDFEVIQNPQSPVLPLLTTDFVIRFHPQSAGHKIAELTIPSNDVDEGVYHLHLYGNYEPEMDVFEAPDGGSYDFGEWDIGTFDQVAFAVDNMGEKELVLEGAPIIVSITGPDCDQFSVEQQPTSPVLPRGRTAFVIRFAPSSEGLKTANISIRNNDWDENPYDITLYGTGTNGPMRISEDTAFVVTSPAEKEILTPGSIHLVTWTGAEAVENVKIEYSIDNGSTFHLAAERTLNTGAFSWLVPDTISGLCLIRVSNADGMPRALKAFAYEFKLKIPSDKEAGGATALKIRASIPDPGAQSNWTAELVLSADSSRDSQGAALNSAAGDFGPLSAFYDRWHQVRIQMEFETYTGSVWLNGRIVLDRVPLRQELGTLLPPEIRISADQSAASGFRVEDIRLDYCDLFLKPQIEGEEVSQSIIKDTFEAYRVGEFPKDGGWLGEDTKMIALSTNQTLSLATGGGSGRNIAFDETQKAGEEKKTAGRPVGGDVAIAEGRVRVSTDSPAGYSTILAQINDEDSFSGSKSFRLEALDGTGVSVSKKFSLPDRLPFGVSEGNFLIGLNTGDIEYQAFGGQELRADNRRLDTRSRRRADLEDNPRARRAAAGADGEEDLSRNRRSAPTASKSPSDGKTSALTLSGPRAGNFYLYSFDGKLLRQYDVYGAILKDFIYMGSRLIAEYDHAGNRYLYYTQDQINSTRIVTDDTGTVVHSQAYSPYGGVQQTWADSYDPLAKFSGKERDAESELDYFEARYYDRGQYRFISVDPKINFQTTWNDSQRLNLYVYCGNRPISFADPDGLSYLEYDNIEGKIRLYSSAGELRGVFPAANNCPSNPYPEGPHKFLRHSMNWINYWPGIDSMGNFIFDVKGHSGMGVHAHEEATYVLQWPDGSTSEYGGLTYKDRTGGCISTTHEGMGAITELHKTDPLTHLDVASGDPIVPECMTTALPLPSSPSVAVTVIIPTALPPAGKINIRPPG
jgi:RHS repeat-associated protein